MRHMGKAQKAQVFVMVLYRTRWHPYLLMCGTKTSVLCVFVFFSITVGMEMKTGSWCCKNMAEDKDLNVMRYPRNRSQIVQH